MNTAIDFSRRGFEHSVRIGNDTSVWKLGVVLERQQACQYRIINRIHAGLRRTEGSDVRTRNSRRSRYHRLPSSEIAVLSFEDDGTQQVLRSCLLSATLRFRVCTLK